MEIIAIVDTDIKFHCLVCGKLEVLDLNNTDIPCPFIGYYCEACIENQQFFKPKKA